MFNDAIIDVAIGMVLSFLAVSLAASRDYRSGKLVGAMAREDPG